MKATTKKGEPNRTRFLWLHAEEIAALEAHFDETWGESWMELARSHYCTLLEMGKGREDVAQIAVQAVQLVHAISECFPGAQLYIPLGERMRAKKRKAEVLLRLQRGESPKAIGIALGLTASHVLYIKAEDLKSRGLPRCAFPRKKDDPKRAELVSRVRQLRARGFSFSSLAGILKITKAAATHIYRKSERERIQNLQTGGTE